MMIFALLAATSAMWTMLIVLGALALLLTWLATAYNTLVKLRNRLLNAFSQIDVQLKRRYDLIPNLVAVVQGYMQHERETLEAVTKARGEAMAASLTGGSAAGGATAARAAGAIFDHTALEHWAGAENRLSGMLGRMMGVIEGYPDLKANKNMLGLQEELVSAENRIAFARQAFNDSVMSYNTAREQFPTNLVAGMFGFTPGTLFEIETSSERAAPQVSFGPKGPAVS